ncbi:hypothetical protein [Oceanobacillus sp. CAU 1775]
MPFRLWILPVILLLILSACTNTTNPDEQRQKNNISFSQTSTNINQNTAAFVKKFIKANKDHEEVYAVNTTDKLILAVIPKQHDRFQLKDFRKEIEKELGYELRQMDLEVTTDRKIALEIEALEEKIRNKKISKHDLEREMERIIKLSKEET